MQYMALSAFNNRYELIEVIISSVLIYYNKNRTMIVFENCIFDILDRLDDIYSYYLQN